MTVKFELWHLISLTITVVGLFIGLSKLLLVQFERRIDEKNAALGDRLDAVKEESKGWRNVETDVLKLRVELAERYVNRDDYIRGQTVIEAKLDAISKDLKSVQIQGAKRET